MVPFPIRNLCSNGYDSAVAANPKIAYKKSIH
ncbi:hypothetical protein SAMN04489760_103145 [Syntrophus gentianae]|uniref:Uncharacterized protein n=1 Tax=Syntrophus gentianae TaxID=43775 RepID=A0A1H7VB26_9BACT|nr:hypothetical protein SAMN04489760_103145 [Syntrophus gentianae]